tara:strand:+ start:1272 stop:1769 length:498 start_codon:yes stop_codon:yes gene_type:complete
MPSIVNNLIESVKSLSRKKNKSLFCNPPDTRIHNFENYYENKIRIEGKESERLRELKKFHDEHPLRAPRKIKQPWRYPWDFDRVFVNTTVTKSGKVKINLYQPFHELYDKYQSKANQPPVEERVRLMKQAHYPEHILINMIKKDQKDKKNAQKNQEFLEKIFGKK